jgi:ATP-dependent Clp protease ATP-binding subunit ClpA
MFERFTGDARTAVVLAQVQARDLGHDYIGTEHLLLALVSTEGSGVKATLHTFGVTADDVTAEILGIVGRGEGAGSGHIPFTPRSKKVLELSLREALALAHNTIRPEHILLGLLREGEGLAAQILFKRGVDLGRLRQQVIDSMPAGPRRTPRGGIFSRRSSSADPSRRRMTSGADKVVDRAADHAGDAPIASQHFLLGLLDDDESVAAKALAALGVTRDEVEAKLAELGTQGTSDEPPEHWGARNTSLQAEGDLVTVKIGDAELAGRVRAMFDSLHVDLLRGPQLPGADRIWLAVRPAIEESVRRFEEQAAATTWEPPGWSKSGIANFAMISKPGGPTPQWWLTSDVDEAAARRFLAEWLVARQPGPGDDEDVVYLTVSVSRAGDVVPNAADPDELIVSHWSSGRGGPRLDWPRVPLAELIAAAVADLSREPAA